MSNQSLLMRAADILLADYLSVRHGEQIVITADTATDFAVVEAVCAMAERLGARVTVARAAQLPIQGHLADPYIPRAQAEAVKACDIWLDLAFPYFAGSHAHDAAMKTEQVRYLLAGDLNAGSFGRLFGMIDLDQYFEARFAFDAVFGPAVGKTCRVTSPIGTDVSFKLAKSQLNQSKPRHASSPGMYLCPGSCSIAPDIDTVKGKIVIDRAFHEFYELTSSPVTLTVDGKITTIAGGGPSRQPLERSVLKAGGGEYGSIIHFTHGLHPAARLTGKSFIEDMRTIGSNAIGLGKPWWEPGGGESHPDAILTEHSVWIENQQIIDRGIIVSPHGLAEQAARLAPTL